MPSLKWWNDVERFAVKEARDGRDEIVRPTDLQPPIYFIRPRPPILNLDDFKRTKLGVCRMMSDWKVELVNDNINELYVEFKGPKESKLRLSYHFTVDQHQLIYPV